MAPLPEGTSIDDMLAVGIIIFNGLRHCNVLKIILIYSNVIRVAMGRSSTGGEAECHRLTQFLDVSAFHYLHALYGSQSPSHPTHLAGNRIVKIIVGDILYLHIVGR